MADEQNTEAGAAPHAEAAEGGSEHVQPEQGVDAGAESDQVATAEAEIAALKDQMLRVQAEAENIRRRAQREVESARKFALEKFCGELLPVLDSLEKAVEAASKATVDTPEVIAIGEGVELSLRMFLGVMNKAGIEQIDPLGEPFDPQRHEAMAMVPNPHAEPNSVIDVMQKGYLLNGRLVRAAMVVVSKSPD